MLLILVILSVGNNNIKHNTDLPNYTLVLFIPSYTALLNIIYMYIRTSGAVVPADPAAFNPPAAFDPIL